MQSDYAGKSSHKIILPLLAERGEGRGEEKNQTTDEKYFHAFFTRQRLASTLVT
jgi:hypothetical protein